VLHKTTVNELYKENEERSTAVCVMMNLVRLFLW